MPPLAFASFTTELLALYRATRAPSTTVKMRQVLTGFAALPGVVSTADLTPAHVAAYVASRPASLSPNTTIGLLSYLRRASSYALAMRYLDVSPFAVWSGWVLPVESAGVRHHGRAEIARVLAHLKAGAGDWAGHRLFALAATVAYTGLRRDEALFLRVEDVDLTTGLLRVVARRRLKRPSAAAPVPIPGPLAEVLGDWLPLAGSDWVFPNRGKSNAWSGGLAGYRPLDRIKQAGLAVGVEGLTFASLRHSFATHAESAWGLGELAVQRILRHTSPRTQRHYRHADLVNLRESVRSVRYDLAG